MKSSRWNPFRALCVVAAILLLCVPCIAARAADLPTRPEYEKRAQHDPDGIGVFYMGREIAQFMSHLAADWLDRTTREEEEKTSRMIALLNFREGETVADIGAGTGYISEKIARIIGTKGMVYATDIQPEMIAKLDAKMKALAIPNVKGLLGAIDDAKLPPAAIDTVILVDVYHEFDHPWEMTRSMIAGLKPGGRLVFVEYRGEDPKVPIKPLHKMTVAQVMKEMAVHPELQHTQTLETLPWQHIIIFQKR
jgi:ubiquinone/menaquinone biosynthesis C-methylase UbiE